MSIKPSAFLAIRDHGVRTYGQLIETAEPDSRRGNCCACHQWGKPTWRLSTRANICEDCCKRKAGETLGSIVKAERAARGYVRNAIKGKENMNFRFYAHLAGVSEEFIRAEYDRQKSCLANPKNRRSARAGDRQRIQRAADAPRN